MNDRSQGGTSLKNGQIQLMQNRRLNSGDDKGMTSQMDERDTSNYNEQVGFKRNVNRTNGDNFGLRVPATYYLEIKNDVADLKESKQRDIQQMVDAPL